MSQVWRNCYKCDYEAETDVNQCPRCGKRLRTATEIRGLGALMIFFGLFLAGIIGAITVFVTNAVNQTNGTSPRGGFTGTEQQLYLIYGIFALVFAVGAVSVITGIWQMAFGRRNKILARAVIVLVAAVSIVGVAFQMMSR